MVVGLRCEFVGFVRGHDGGGFFPCGGRPRHRTG